MRQEKAVQTNIFPSPNLFNGLLRSVPPIDPTSTICFTPATLAEIYPIIHQKTYDNVKIKINYWEKTHQHLFDFSAQSSQPKNNILPTIRKKRQKTKNKEPKTY